MKRSLHYLNSVSTSSSVVYNEIMFSWYIVLRFQSRVQFNLLSSDKCYFTNVVISDYQHNFKTKIVQIGSTSNFLSFSVLFVLMSQSG